MTLVTLRSLVFAATILAALLPAPTVVAAPACVPAAREPVGQVLVDTDIVESKRGNFAAYQFVTPGPLAVNMLLTVDVWASADYTPPNPTWFVTTIKSGYESVARRNPVAAQGDSYRDGNAQRQPFSNSLAVTQLIPPSLRKTFYVEAHAEGPGAVDVSKTTLCIGLRGIALD
jgi:hypothetical protein